MDWKKKRQKLKQDGKNYTSNPPEVIKVNDNRDDKDEEDGEEKEETPQIQFGDLSTTSVALEEALERKANLHKRMDKLEKRKDGPVSGKIWSDWRFNDD